MSRRPVSRPGHVGQFRVSVVHMRTYGDETGRIVSLGGRPCALDPELHRKSHPARQAKPMTWQRRMTIYLLAGELTPAQRRRVLRKRGRVG